jgi:folylpolyglutamate synthase/dihydropteroate synthase
LRGICEALAPIGGFVLLPKIRSERAADSNALQKIFVDLGCESKIFSSFADAFGKAGQRSSRILITGSLHFAGEALAYLRGEPAAFEECGQ